MEKDSKKELLYHSVRLETDYCKGCTTCMRYCPTQAIRVQHGKAKIIREKCIDCGECVRRCPYRAKKVLSDSFDALENYKHNIALVAPAFGFNALSAPLPEIIPEPTAHAIASAA